MARQAGGVGVVVSFVNRCQAADGQRRRRDVASDIRGLDQVVIGPVSAADAVQDGDGFARACIFICKAAALRQRQHISALHTHQAATADTGSCGGVIHLGGHGGAADGQVALVDAGRHANVAGQFIVVAIAVGGVQRQACQQHSFAHTHVFVTELSGCRAQEAHAVTAQACGDGRACDHRIGVGVVILVDRSQTTQRQHGAADVGCDICGLIHRIVGCICARQTV